MIYYVLYATNGSVAFTILCLYLPNEDICLIPVCPLKWLHALLLKQYPYWRRCTPEGKNFLPQTTNFVSFLFFFFFFPFFLFVGCLFMILIVVTIILIYRY